MGTPPDTPLSHHAILELMAPFAAAGWALDLAASDRAARRLVFKPVAHAATAAHPALLESRELQDGRNGWRLQRRLALQGSDALAAEIVAEGDDVALLLQRAASLAPDTVWRRTGPQGPWVALCVLCGESPTPRLREAEAHVAGLHIECTVSGVKGYPAQIELVRDETDTRRLPDDLFEVLGGDWSRLTAKRRGWETGVMLRGEGAARSRDAEAKLLRTLAHLQQTLSEPPARFHERFLARRWRIGLLRGSALALGVAIVAVAFAVRGRGGAAEAALGALANLVPPLLMALFFLRREMPRIELPRPPRRPAASSWQPWPTPHPTTADKPGPR